MTYFKKQLTSNEQRIRDLMPALFLIDVALMFSGIFLANAAAWWIWLPFHSTACAYTAFVLYLSHIASRSIPQSVPFQHAIGVWLYISCHSIQFFVPDQIPLVLVGYLMLASPISIIFLFDHLADDRDC